MAEAFYEGRDLEVLADMPNYYAWIMETFAPYVSGRTIEYGAGTGTISALLAPSATALTLVEPSGNLVEVLRARFARDPVVEIKQEFLEKHVAAVASASIDTIVMVNVLEHVEDDRAALTELLRVLKPGGHILIFVPALQFLMSELDRVHGHFRRYHKGDLVSKVEQAGGHTLVCRYFDVPGVLSWLLINKMLGSITFNPTLVRIYDRLVVPVTRLGERMIALPFGKNLILIARKQ